MADGGVGCAGGVGWTGGVGWAGGGTGGVGWAGGNDVVVQAASESATAVSGTSRLRRLNDINK
jgi:hypothetical protein